VGPERTLRVAARIASVTGAAPELIAAIEIALGPLGRSPWPQVAWRFSRLTQTHCPVEFTFSSDDDRLRVTLEVAGPETPDDERLEAGLNLLAVLGLPAPTPASVAEWRGLQAEGPLRWGCWLGLRQTAGGFGTKLYIEAPRSARAKRWASALPGAQLRMLGHDLQSGRTELYFALPAIDPPEAIARLRALGMADAQSLLEDAAGVIGLPLAAALRWSRLGVSIADDRSGVALFVDSRSVAGGPASVRRRMMARQATSYAALLGGRLPDDLPDHGVLTFTPHAGATELRVGIAADGLA
jgi:hypothetical protein